MIDLMRYACLRCGHTWESRVKKPAACPKCKSYSYDTESRYTEKDKKEGKK